VAAGSLVSAPIAATVPVERAGTTPGAVGAVAIAAASDARTAATAVTVEGGVGALIDATDLVVRETVAPGTGGAVAVAIVIGALAAATDLAARGLVALGAFRAFGAVVIAGARPLPGAPGRASRRATLAICPVRGRRGIGEGARAAAAAPRGRVAAPGPGAQVDDRGRFTPGVEAAQRRHRGVRAGSGEIREASDPVRDLPAG